MALKYQVLLADADDTLFDFTQCERAALTATLNAFSLPVKEEYLSLYAEINDGLWKALERGEITQGALRIERFRLFLNALSAPADSTEMNETYITELSKGTFLMPGAEAFVREVSRAMPIYLVTNGIAQVQKSRLSASRLAPYIAGAVISQEVGAAKPDPKMVYAAMEKAGVQDKRRAVMLGDSLTADLGAARAAGVDFCLLQKKGPLPQGATYQAESLMEALPIILERRA